LAGSAHTTIKGKAVLANRFNWLALGRALRIFEHPHRFIRGAVSRQAPQQLSLRTPTGRVLLALRNFESLRTLFSIFCREDYRTQAVQPAVYVDVGANIGIAAVYFLSRHPRNIAICFEPDAANLEYLRHNLAPFGSRARIVEHAVGVHAGTMTLFRSEDGKYSSLIASARATMPQEAIVESFDTVLRDAAGLGLPVVVKLDVEGMETELVRHTRFESHARVTRLICESTQCAELITRPHQRTLRSGYVEDLVFVA
jgi:FkbM family methyltransferase